MVYLATPAAKQVEVVNQSRLVTGLSILVQLQAIRGALESLIQQDILGLVVEVEAEQDFMGILQWAGEGLHLQGVTASVPPVELWPTSCAQLARGCTTAAHSVSAVTGKFTATPVYLRPRSYIFGL